MFFQIVNLNFNAKCPHYLFTDGALGDTVSCNMSTPHCLT